MLFKGKSFLVVGVGESGVSVAEKLLSFQANVFLFDERDSSHIGRLKKLGCVDLSAVAKEEVLTGIYAVIVSPGVPLTDRIVLLAQEKNIPVLGELEFAFQLCKGRTLAVTGTNGKTTTVSLLAEILKEQGENSFLLGNIGTPFSQKVQELSESDFAVLEVSSFQLETIHTFRPDVAAVLNISEDHLNRHGTMEKYTQCKARIFENQTSAEFAVLNADCERVLDFTKGITGKRVFFSKEREVFGVYIQEERIISTLKGWEEICSLSDVRLLGEHNLENVLCAVCIAKLCEVESAAIKRVLRRFSGIDHRLQFVKTVGGVSYFNDSKATNVDSTICAVRTMKVPTIILLGGSEKGSSFCELFRAFNENITCAIVFGDARFRLLEDAKQVGFQQVFCCSTLDEGVILASKMAKSGTAVLLSPACASFDQFENFEARGRRFVELVEELCQ